MITIKNASKVYKMGDEEIKALDDVSFKVEDGEFLAIVGPSGSGKSTLMHMIGGLDSLDKGNVAVNDRDLKDFKDKEFSRYRNKFIGFVFQNFYLQPSISAIENVELPLIFSGINKKERKVKALNALKKVDLENRLKHKPSQLSGGERQRVSIARAIVNDPKIVLADEPTGNLDSKTGENIVDLLKELNQDLEVTIIVVTHDDRVAKKAKRILRIHDGRIVEDVRNGVSEVIKKHTD